MSQKPNRRRFLKVAGAAVAGTSSIVAGCMGSDTPSDQGEANTGTNESDGYADEINFYGWGGGWNDAWMNNVADPFEEEFGTKVKPSGFADESEMLSNIRSSPEGSFDIVGPSISGIYRGTKQDLYEPINPDEISTWSNLLPTFKDFGPDRGDSVHVTPTHYGTRGIGFNTDYTDAERPLTWELLWKDKFGGKLTLRDDAPTRVYDTAFHLGIDPNNLAEDDYDAKMKKIYDAMAKQHELVRKYWKSGQDQMSIFSNEEAHVGEAWGGRILKLQDQGNKQLKYAIPENGVMAWGAGLAIAKGSKKATTAKKFMEFTLRPEIHKNLVADLGYPPTTDVESEAVKNLPDYDPSGGDRLTFPDQEFIANHREEWANTFDKIKLGQY